MRDDIINQAEAIREAMDAAGAVLTDEQALICVRLYKPYEVGKAYVAGEFFVYGVNNVGDPQLYKVVQDHTSQNGWNPTAAASLYEQINETHAGTEDDPIPYSGNMALESGKYYMQDYVVYLCTRDTINPVYNPLSELVGIYVTEI